MIAIPLWVTLAAIGFAILTCLMAYREASNNRLESLKTYEFEYVRTKKVDSK